MDCLIIRPTALPHGFQLRNAETVAEGGEAAAETVEADEGQPCRVADRIDVLCGGADMRGNQLTFREIGDKLTEPGNEDRNIAIGGAGLGRGLVDGTAADLLHEGAVDMNGGVGDIRAVEAVQLAAPEGVQGEQSCQLTVGALDGLQKYRDLLGGEPRLAAAGDCGEMHIRRELRGGERRGKQQPGIGLTLSEDASSRETGKTLRDIQTKATNEAIEKRLNELGEKNNPATRSYLVEAIKAEATGQRLSVKEKRALQASKNGAQVAAEYGQMANGEAETEANAWAYDNAVMNELTRAVAVKQTEPEEYKSEWTTTERERTDPRKFGEIPESMSEYGNTETMTEEDWDRYNAERDEERANEDARADAETQQNEYGSYVRGLMKEMTYATANRIKADVNLREAWESITGQKLSGSSRQQTKQIMDGSAMYIGSESYVRGLMMDMDAEAAQEIFDNPAYRDAWERITGKTAGSVRAIRQVEMETGSNRTVQWEEGDLPYDGRLNGVRDELMEKNLVEIDTGDGNIKAAVGENRGKWIGYASYNNGQAVTSEGTTRQAAVDNLMKEIENNGRQNEYGARAGSERTVGVGAEGSAEDLAGEAGQDQSAEGRKERINALDLRRDSAAAQGVSNGTETVKNRFFRPGDSENVDRLIKEDDELTTVVNRARERGQNIIFFTGLLEINEDGKVVLADGVQQGKDIYVRADGTEHSPLKIYEHEDTHDAIEASGGENGALYQSMKERLIRSLGGKAQFEELKAKYAEALPDGYSEYDIVQEMLSDARGTMNDFKGNTKLKAELDEEVRQQLGERRTGNTISAEEEAAFRGGEPVSSGAEFRLSRARDSELEENARAYNDKNGGLISEDVLSKAREDRAHAKRLLDEMAEKNPEMLPDDIEGQTIFANSSYAQTAENSTLCPRSMLLDDLSRAVSTALGRPLTFEEEILVTQEAANWTDKPECIYCYVASDRKMYSQSLGRYIQQRDDAIEMHRQGATTAEIAEAVMGIKETDKKRYNKTLQNRINGWCRMADNGAVMLTESDLAGLMNRKEEIAERRENLPPEKRAEFDIATRYAQGAARGKLRRAYAAYNGQILKMPQRTVNNLNSQFGLRMYSFTDYSPAFVLENMQMIEDAAAKGLKILAYTKEMDFARIFASTGANINISVHATKGRDMNGDFGMDAMQGADWEEARALRSQYEGVGITMVCENDEQVEWALEQDWIDVVIPFHSVFGGGNIAAKMFGWKNYKDMQEDGKLPEWHKGDQKSIYPPVHQNDLIKYADALIKNNLKPRFAEWLQGFDEYKAGNLTAEKFREMNPSYMKLVNETRRASTDTPAVQPKFKEKDFGALAIFALVSYLMNEPLRELFGFDVSWDPINAAIEAVQSVDEDDNAWQATTKIAGRLAGETMSNMAYGSQLTQLLVSDDNTRKKLFGEGDPTRFGTGQIGINMITDPILDLITGDEASEDILEAVLNTALPYGGKQATRLVDTLQTYGVLPEVSISTEDGISAFRQKGGGAAYTASGRLKYAPESTWDNWVRSLLFGNLTTREGMEYLENGSPMSEEMTEEFRRLTEAGVQTTRAAEIVKGLSEIKNAKGQPTGQKQLDAISYLSKAGISEESQKDLYYSRIASDAQKEKIDAMDAAMMDWNDISDALTTYYALEQDDNLSASQKASALAGWAMSNLTMLQAQTVRDSLTYSSGFKANTNSFDAYVESGLEPMKASEVVMMFSNIRPEAGRDQPTEMQKMYSLSTASYLSDEDRFAVTGAMMGTEMQTASGGMSQYAKMLTAQRAGMTYDDFVSFRAAEKTADKARTLSGTGLSNDAKLAVADTFTTEAQSWYLHHLGQYGVSLDVWANFLQRLPLYDADGNGSYKQAEVAEALRAMKLEDDTKAALWQMQTGGSKNPFNPALGKKISKEYKNR